MRVKILASILFVGAVGIATTAMGDPLFLGTPPTWTDVKSPNLTSTFSVVTGSGNTVGKLTVTGAGGNHEGDFEPGPSQITISSESFALTVYFDLNTGSFLQDATHQDSIVISGDAASASSDGLIHAGSQTFYDSTTLTRVGEQLIPPPTGIATVDFAFSNNLQGIFPGLPVYTALVSGLITFNESPSANPFEYSTSSGEAADAVTNHGGVLWHDDGTGTANTWAPIPNSGIAGFVLLGIFGAARLFKRRFGLVR